MQKTCINVKPCNIGNSEAHNRRTAEYLAHVPKKKLYIRTDLMARNETWVNPDFGDTSLTDRYNQIAAMVKEKTGRAMQTKDRERVNKKTGRVTIVRGSTPLKEGVVVIQENTTMDQLRHFCQACHEQWGITALQIFIHRDEGHYADPEDKTTWKPNYHAHIVWDWMNHDTGKSYKLNDEDMSRMQTLLAECLEMERGVSKALTGNEHLERNDFIIAKQKREAEQAKAQKEAAVLAKEEAEQQRQSIEEDNRAKEEYGSALDAQIADKERQLKEERRNAVDSILDSVGSVVGIGKKAGLERENKSLREEIGRLREAFPAAVKDKVAERTRVLSAEKRAAQQERDKAVAQRRAAVEERDQAVRQLHNQTAGERQRISEAVSEATAEKDEKIRLLQDVLKAKKDLLHVFAEILYKANQVFRRAIDAIISFSVEKYQSIFHNDQAADIKHVMQTYGETTNQRKAVGTWLCDYAETLQTFDDVTARHTRKEVTDVAEGKYDWRIERSGRGVSR